MFKKLRQDSSMDSEDVEMQQLQYDGEGPKMSRPGSEDGGSGSGLEVGRWRRFGGCLKKGFHTLFQGPAQPVDEPPTFDRYRLLAQLEDLPARIAQSVPRNVWVIATLAYYALWLLLLRSFLLPYLSQPPKYLDAQTGDPAEVLILPCGAARDVWRGENDACGLNGHKCGPGSRSLEQFLNNRSEVVIRCPALCDYGSMTYGAIEVGTQAVRYRNYYVGGGDDEASPSYTAPFRADSFPCGAAVHAGVVSPVSGGYAKLEFLGPQSSFNRSANSKHESMDKSTPFDSFFPESFRVIRDDEGHCQNCKDPRVYVALANILLGLPVTYLSQSGLFLFWTACVSGFWTIVLSFDPPLILNTNDQLTVPRLVSIGFRRFLPLCFVLVVVWKLCCRTTLSSPSSQLCKVFVWLPLFWVGMLNNVTFDRLPVDRLTLKDMKTMPGSALTIAVLLTVIAGCVVIQARKIWQAGRWTRYFAGYSVAIAALLVLSSFGGLQLRLHHYIIGLLLLPGTGTKGFTAYLFQSLLVGLVVNGVARWGFASIVETDLSLMRDDSAGRVDPPVFAGYSPANQTLSWEWKGDKPEKSITTPLRQDSVQQKKEDVETYSLLVNDFEAYRGPNVSVTIEGLSKHNEEFGTVLSDALDSTEGDVKMYLRVSYLGRKGDKRSAFSKAGVLLYPSGKFESGGMGST